MPNPAPDLAADLTPIASLDALAAQLQAFAQERQWQPFHTPKNLASALVVEAGELLEPFQWLTDEQSLNLGEEARQAVADEMADVLMYLVRMASVMDIDLLQAATRKLALNAQRYPAEQVKGSARKADA